MPYFSICIPTYNRANTLERTLKSLENQTFKDFEIIVVDDGSTDDSELLINKIKDNSILLIRYYKKENGGKHTALNVGIKNALGEFFLILDSDDTLDKNSLLDMYDKCNKIINNSEYCGVIGKAANRKGEIIGNEFPKEGFVSSYIDFHFGSGFDLKGNGYGDCCECIRTSLLKKYSYPINGHTKFVPESLILDIIGLDYKLLCTNQIYKIVEYMDDGITKNHKTFKEKNIVGFIYKYVSNIEEILPNTKLPIIVKVVLWWQYWSAIKKDENHYAPRCKKVSLIGYLVKFAIPLLNIAHKLSRT